MSAVTPRVVLFAGGELGALAAALLCPHLVGVVASETSVDEIEALQPTHGVSAGYRHILRRPVIDLFPHGIANVHTSLLPHGRGAHPNAWTIALGKPAGVTLHLIDEGVDTGPILAQRPTVQHGWDTAKTLQERLLADAGSLMRDWLPKWIEDPASVPARAQTGIGATRRICDLESLEIQAWGLYTGHQFMRLLRARTYPPHPGARYIDEDGKRYRVRIEIEEERA